MTRTTTSLIFVALLLPVLGAGCAKPDPVERVTALRRGYEILFRSSTPKDSTGELFVEIGVTNNTRHGLTHLTLLVSQFDDRETLLAEERITVDVSDISAFATNDRIITPMLAAGDVTGVVVEVEFDVAPDLMPSFPEYRDALASAP